MIFIEILFIALILIIIYQDIKYRLIDAWIFLALLITVIIKSALMKSAKDLLIDSSMNLFFLSIQFILLKIFLSIKQKKITKIMDVYIGVGDCFLFVIICFMFSIVNFITFYIFSLMIITFFIYIYIIISKNKIKYIPLAGLVSILILLGNSVFMMNHIFNIFNPGIIEQMINIF